MQVFLQSCPPLLQLPNSQREHPLGWELIQARNIKVASQLQWKEWWHQIRKEGGGRERGGREGGGREEGRRKEEQGRDGGRGKEKAYFLAEVEEMGVAQGAVVVASDEDIEHLM